MNKVTKFDLGRYVSLPNPGLLAYFRHTGLGSNVDIRPPMWDGETRAKVVQRWSDILFAGLRVKSVPGLAEYEEEMQGKIGPLSIQEPLYKRIPKIEEYYTDIKLPSVPIDDRAIDAFLKTVKPIKAQLRGIKRTLEDMRLSTNSGTPYFTKRRRVSGTDSIAAQSRWSNDLARSGELLPAVLGWRGQEGGPEPEDVKQRVLFMFPFIYNVWELQAYQSLVELWQHYNINSAYMSMRAVEVKLTNLFNTKGDDYCVVTDFTGFDQHFNPDLQAAAKKCIKYQLYDRGDKWLSHVFPIKYNIPLLCDKSLMYTGTHGMGSGSGGTNFDETNSHSCMQHESAIKRGKSLNPYSNAYGDDGYLSYPGIDVDDVIEDYTSHGQVMNPSKQSVSKHSAIYLRRYFHDSYRDKWGIMLGVYPTMRALGRLLGQERYVTFEQGSQDYARYTVLRSLSILENCANHPMFDKFVDFVMSGDRYKLGLAIPGFLESIDKQFQEFAEHNDNLLGYTKTLQSGRRMTGMGDWKVVKYLLSQR